MLTFSRLSLKYTITFLGLGVLGKIIFSKKDNLFANFHFCIQILFFFIIF